MLNRPLLRERKQLLDQSRAALRGIENGRAFLRRLVAVRLSVAQQRRMDGDNAEDVVEIMRDAPGQRSDRLHLLRLAQLRLELLALIERAKQLGVGPGELLGPDRDPVLKLVL